MERSPRFSVLLCVVFIAAVEVRVTTSADEKDVRVDSDIRAASLRVIAISSMV